MGPLVRICWMTMVVGAAIARPSAEISERDSRGQTITDTSDPLEKAKPVELNEAYKGGVVPVALMYDNPESEEVVRPLRDAEFKSDEDIKSDSLKEKKGFKPQDIISGEEERGNRVGMKNSKLLDIEARENDENENAKFGLEIQSRNKAPSEEDKEELEKPFVYNIQPLSFYSSETKEEENILNYINKIKEMRENQIKFEAQKKKQNQTVVEKYDESVVTETDSEEDNGPIRRKIQHFETIIKPMAVDQQSQMYGSLAQTGYPLLPASTAGLSEYPQTYQQSVYPHPYQQGIYTHPYQQNIYNPFYQPNVGSGFYQGNQQPSTVVYLPNPFRKQQSTKISAKNGNTRILDDYFPILINNPFNEIWAGITNIVEYGQQADVCKKSKKGREADEENTTEIDLTSQRIGGVGSSKADNTWPKLTKLKVRRGGVAIAGPGGIATAGSGGTAIVGPGGTAYTTREGTAVVGPGGRVVHVPQFPIYAKNVDDVKPRDITSLPGSKTVAEGPIIYYDNPLDTVEISDPSFPL